MGLVTSALQIGRSALLSYQSALQIIGNNVSNAGSPDYTRQSVDLTPVNGVTLPEGFQPGAGVALTALQRNLDEALEHRLRLAIGGRQSVGAEDAALSRIEVMFDVAGGAGLAGSITTFFNHLSEVQNDPADTGIRTVAIASGQGLATSLRQLRRELLAIGQDADSQIATLAQQADQIADQIADLNARIVVAEAGNRAPASALRDQRDALLRDLSGIVDVRTRQQPDGSLYVYIGNEALIQSGLSRGLTSEVQRDGEFTRTALRFADTGALVTPRGGVIEGLVIARDEHAYGRIAQVDQLAAGIITEVNRVHADGQGLAGWNSVTGTVSLTRADVPLDSADAGMSLTPNHGSFFIVVADDTTHTPVAYQIEVDLDGQDPDSTLASLVDDINALNSGVTAGVTADNRLMLDASPGLSFTFGHDGQAPREDTSGVLAALGVNTFFQGSSAADIAVNPLLESAPEMLAAATVSLAGDGSNAGRLAVLDVAHSTVLGDASILDFYNAAANDVAVTAGAAHQGAGAADAILSALQAQKESISGVSLDEEALNLLKFERAFQGAARYVSVVDRMLDEVMALTR